MATWIAHLRIAEKLLVHIPGLDPGQFAIGNIAPDSGIPDKNKEPILKPEVTHFKKSTSVHKDIADLDFYRQYLLNVDQDDTPRFSFRLGYFFHLITDNLWTIHVGIPTQEKFAEDFTADDDFIWEVKKDWYGLDHIYVREHPDCIYWRVFLNAEPASVDLSFLPSKAISRHLDFVKMYYQMEVEEISAMMTRPMKYLSKDEMDGFIESAVGQILRIYRILWPTPPVLEEIKSSLALLKSLP